MTDRLFDITNPTPPNPIPEKKKGGVIGWASTSLQSVWGIFSSIFWGIARIFGINPPVPNRIHEHIDRGDVADAMAAERDRQEGLDVVEALEPADVVLEYARSTLRDDGSRSLVDLSALTPEQQDWLTGLSDKDLSLIAVYGRQTAARSLEHKMMIPVIPREQRARPEPEVLPIPDADVYSKTQMTKSDFRIIREGIRSAVSGTPRPFDYRPH